jgi:hypothetical protein
VFAGDGTGADGGGDVSAGAGVGADGGGDVVGWRTGVWAPGVVGVPALVAGGAA